MIKLYPSELCLIRGSYGSTLLHVACAFNRMKIATQLLTAGCDVHAVDDYNKNILHICCEDNHYDLLKYLLQFVTVEDIHKRDDVGYAPVVYASMCASLECLQLLINKVENVEDVKLAIKKACRGEFPESEPEWMHSGLEERKKNKDEILKVLNDKLK